jgi:hypothetical protein
MDEELTISFSLLQRRLALTRELASSLEQAQNAVVRSDLRGIEGHSALQRELCEALRQLESEARGQLPRSPVADESGQQQSWVQLPEDAVSPLVERRWKVLAQELSQVEMRVRQLNRAYGALLRRAQRTLQIFLRVLASSGNTYAPPKCAPASAPSALREVSHV